jgi:hypothetical protein
MATVMRMPLSLGVNTVNKCFLEGTDTPRIEATVQRFISK